jgi:hypothetical protein
MAYDDGIKYELITLKLRIKICIKGNQYPP